MYLQIPETQRSNYLFDAEYRLERCDPLRLEEKQRDAACGKTLCSRHRAAQSHTCSKVRAKLQQVRRHRHLPAPSTCRQRARSKPRVAHREGSSSDDNETSHAPPVLPVRRGVSSRAMRSVAIRGGAARCS
ncbi:hypothetical protein ANCDUO_19519, partial [Ancylostoma duodenale]